MADQPQVSHERAFVINADDVGEGEDRRMHAMSIWLRRLQEEAPELYGAPGQAPTLSQAWYQMGAMGIIARLVLVEAYAEFVDTSKVPSVTIAPLAGIMRRIRTCFELGAKSMVAAVNDGGYERVITLFEWRNDSLIVELGGQLSSLQVAVFEAHLIGVLAWPGLWAEAGGEPGALRYADCATTDFWATYVAQERSRERDEHDAAVVRLALTEPDITVELRLDKAERTRSARLHIPAGRILRPEDGVNARTLRLAARFLRDFVPPADRADAAAYTLPESPAELIEFAIDPTQPAAPDRQLATAYLGGIPNVALRFGMCTADVKHPSPDQVTITITTF
jgi:hypothetical protein